MNESLFSTTGLGWYLVWLYEAMRYTEQLRTDAVRTAEHLTLIGTDALQKVLR